MSLKKSILILYLILMIPPIFRYILVFLLVIYSAFVHYNGSFGVAIYTYFAAALVLLTTLFTGTVFKASNEINNGDFDQAEKTLNKTYFPNLLLKRNKANFHFMKGMVELHKKNFEQGDNHLKKSLEIGLKTPTNKALAYLNLAHSSFLKGDFTQCRTYLDIGKALDANLHVLKKIEEMENALTGIMN